MKRLVLGILSIMTIALWSACDSSEPILRSSILELPATPYNYSFSQGNNVPTLGRVLFYDPRLSINNSISCASCHKQNLAFSDDAQFSVGFENRKTTRNSMPIQNLNFFNSVMRFDGTEVTVTGTLFWDGRETELKKMVLRPIANHVEMGVFDFDVITKKLSSIDEYEVLFEEAYGTSEVTQEKIADALASFLVNIRADNTKLDRASRGEIELSALEKTGQQLFFQTYNCNNCHQVQEPSGYLDAGGFANIGLDQPYEDPGLEQTTRISADVGKFKIPSLRNVRLTAPYMHDGRFESLEAVIDHYSEGMQSHPNLDFRLRAMNGQPLVMNISDNDKVAIIEFLNTLTDATMISDPKFSNPFKAH